MRRITAFLGILVLLLLTALLLWRVWLHHTRAGRDEEEMASRPAIEKIASVLR